MEFIEARNLVYATMTDLIQESKIHDSNDRFMKFNYIIKQNNLLELQLKTFTNLKEKNLSEQEAKDYLDLIIKPFDNFSPEELNESRELLVTLTKFCQSEYHVEEHERALQNLINETVAHKEIPDTNLIFESRKTLIEFFQKTPENMEKFDYTYAATSERLFNIINEKLEKEYADKLSEEEKYILELYNNNETKKLSTLFETYKGRFIDAINNDENDPNLVKQSIEKINSMTFEKPIDIVCAIGEIKDMLEED